MCKKIGNIRRLEIVIYDKNNEIIFEDNSEKVSEEIKALVYTRIEVGKPTKLYL